MDEHTNVALVRQTYADFSRGDIPGLLQVYSDDVRWHIPPIPGVPFGGTRTGKAAVVAFFQELASVQEALEFEPEEYVAQGDTVVAMGHYRWRVKATGREFEGDWVHVVRVRDGQIVSFHEYTDTAAVASAYAAAVDA